MLRQYDAEQTTSGHSSSDSVHLSLDEILVSADGLDLFANHLVTEFCTENILFVFELMQIKREAIDRQLCRPDAAGTLIPFPDSKLQKYKRKGMRINNIEELASNMENIKEQYIFHNAEHSLVESVREYGSYPLL